MTEVARGVYRYWCDGALQTITEPWQLLRTAQGLLLRGQRLVDGRVVLDVEAQYDGALCNDLHLCWHTPTSQHRAQYRYRGIKLEWSFDQQHGVQTLALPADSRLFPLLRAATGPLLKQLSAAPRTVVVPCIRDATADDFLHPLLSSRHAKTTTAQHYRYYGGEYGDAGCECWLDTHCLLLRYQWQSPQGGWEVRLEDLWTAQDFKGFERS